MPTPSSVIQFNWLGVRLLSLFLSVCLFENFASNLIRSQGGEAVYCPVSGASPPCVCTEIPGGLVNGRLIQYRCSRA